MPLPPNSQMDFALEIRRSWDEGVAAFAANARISTPFQNGAWIASWYRNLGTRSNIVPLILLVRRTMSGELAAIVPLVTRMAGLRRVIEFADLGITDYNAPLLLAAAPTIATDAAAMLRVVVGKLASEGDILHLTKMPVQIGDAPNPFALAKDARSSALCTNVVRIEGAWDEYRRSLDGKVRREFDRCWRVFLRDGDDARFVRPSSREEAHRLLSQIEILQRNRFAELGLPFALDEEGCSRFYHELVEEGFDSGYAIVTALMSGPGEVVAGLLSVRHGDGLAMIRLGFAGAAWAHCSPGRLLFERTMLTLREGGVTEFDFTIGNYPYKEVFRVERKSLIEVVWPLTWRGHATHGIEQAGYRTKQRLRSVQALYSPLKQMARLIRS